MKEMSTSPQQIMIFYNVGNTSHEKTVAHAKGTGKQILAIPFDQAPTAYNIWTQIWEGLGPDKRDIFDDADERYQELIAGREFDFEDWRNIVIHNSDLIRNPIAISGTKVIAIERPGEIYRLQELGPDQDPIELPESEQAGNEVDEFGVKLPG